VNNRYIHFIHCFVADASNMIAFYIVIRIHHPTYIHIVQIQHQIRGGREAWWYRSVVTVSGERGGKMERKSAIAAKTVDTNTARGRGHHNHHERKTRG